MSGRSDACQRLSLCAANWRKNSRNGLPYLPRKARELVVIEILRDNLRSKHIGILDDKHVAFRCPVIA